ncbi:MAG: chloride channel protein [Betaproteobacteria bacterium]|nr:chloride channel protein [Betaproteobacteria bacterium]
MNSAGQQEAGRSLGFMILVAILTGVIAGIGAWAFRMLIGLVHNVLFLGEFVFQYDANRHAAASPWDWGVILVPVAGALFVAWLVRNFAPEARGHGVPEVMDAIYYNRGVIRPRVAMVKSLASAVSIGSGAAVGREGPIIQIGSAFGSTVGQLIRMSVHDRVTLIAAGAGAGIAATFNAPLGGIVFTIELLLASVNARTLLMVASATATATYISHWLLGVEPSFYIPELEYPNFHLDQGWTLVAFFPLGALLGLLSVVFIRSIYAMEKFFDRIPGNYYTRHALGMLCVGIMMYLMFLQAGHYYIQGVGYATIMDVLQGTLTNPWFLLLLLVLKLLATGLSLGSGASGGVFSPALFMGAAAGAAFGHLCLLFFPHLQLDMPTFAIAGMAAAIGGSTGAFITAIVMISEMTQDPTVILPLIITVSTAYAVRKHVMRESIYTMKLIGRGHTVPEGLQAPFLTNHTARDAMNLNFAVAREDTVAPDSAIVIMTNDERITGVFERVSAGAEEARQGGQDRKPWNYIVVGERENLLNILESMVARKTDIALVSRRSGSESPEDIIGVVTSAHIAALIRQWQELL